MARDLTLSIDVGTGSVRAALVDGRGGILTIASREHDQIVPAFGWAEQRPSDWWAGVVHAIRATLAAVEGARERIAAICACGQMHGTVLVDAAGRPTRNSVPLWNDKRTAGIVAAFEAANPPASYLAESGNPPTPAWPGFKLAWLRDHDPEAYAAAAAVIMPKDFINLKLTGEIAMDSGDASCSFLMNPRSRAWSPAMIARLGLDAAKLPPIREPLDILGAVTAEAAAETGLAEGTPVLVGGADYPVALLGSGACRPGLASDVTGTSCILTLIAEAPLLDPEICNVATVEGQWGPFVLLETGGDAMRWARRAFHDKALGYEAIVARAAEAPAGADGLLFMPYLTGERLGAHRNARAQFFGLGAAHGLPHLHRAVMEGVAFAAARHLGIMERAAGARLERVIASGGGAKTALWLKIKASIYGIPIVVPREAECGVVGCAAMAATATGRFADIHDAVAATVRHTEEIAPDPAWTETYGRMQPVFDRLYAHSQALYDDLDRLAAANAAAAGRSDGS
ncbi:xylulokinase [Labrys wisconsinensis]|uniref:Xylulokinase n=1 Tax=Labrys wisconsinensis TaxID=425677 RepID=A0ABU0JPB8_9HYPH|nr:FGGY family carbohydrate kinase [Labrys wisconsinensis]MDQ0475228.1 xylulokinase [Labrys wisconsinensis]